MLDWINPKEFLPGDSEGILLMKIIIDGVCNMPEYETGFYDAVWMLSSGEKISEHAEVIGWTYIKD